MFEYYYFFKSTIICLNMKSSDAKASKCHLKFFFEIHFYQACIFKFSDFT